MSSFSNKQFVDGVTVLTLSTVFVKVIGLVYKIPLMRVLGAEGMGYFNSAYEMYTLFFVVATAGIPVAISIMISENVARGKISNSEKIFGKSLTMLGSIGTLGALFMCFGSELIAKAINSPASAPSILFVSPTVFFISISAAIRGYYQGQGNMTPTALSQMVESLGKLFLGLLFAVIAKRKGLPTEMVAAFSILGLTMGTAIGCVYLCVVRFIKKPTKLIGQSDFRREGEIVCRLIRLAVPVTVSSVIVCLTRIIDMSMLMGRLSGVNSISVYGSYSTMVLPIYNLPSSLVSGIALALVPAATGAMNSFKVRKDGESACSAFKLCAVISLPAAFGISIYGKQILEFLFYKENEAIAVAYPLLEILGASIPASCLLLVSNSLLQACGKTLYPIYSILLGIGVKWILAYVLIGIPYISAAGAPISTLVCNIVSVAISFYFVERFTVFRINLREQFLKPLSCAFLSSVFSLMVFIPLQRCGVNERVAFVIAGAAYGLSYVASIILTKTLDDEEISAIPFGNRAFSKNKNKGSIKNEQRRTNRKAFGKEGVRI